MAVPVQPHSPEFTFRREYPFDINHYKLSLNLTKVALKSHVRVLNVRIVSVRVDQEGKDGPIEEDVG